MKLLAVVTKAWLKPFPENNFQRPTAYTPEGSVTQGQKLLAVLNKAHYTHNFNQTNYFIKQSEKIVKNNL